ncbi:FAD:protein FMN transferase [Streptomyces orinoci]|uniref:FAD:protein FMN transferase n=2 Tax=Streptomyces orinoci TaxID=67339 RepID=A0ABV3JRH6_STRON|nr:FAD:protein FMN transferase [Streptomyces orinoci]
MGTVFSFDLRDPATPAVTRALAAAVRLLHQVDAVFSTYRPDSAVSRLGRGEITVDRCPPEVGEVLRLCALAEQRTGGFFSATAAGRLDPSGLVKGWAVERAADLLLAAGARNLCVNGGGDLRLCGEAAPGEPWRIGLADPRHPGRLTGTVQGRDMAVATSGTAERGAHITDPHTGRPATALLAVTVVGPSLTWADVHATAHMARGRAVPVPGYPALAVHPDGTRTADARFPSGDTS